MSELERLRHRDIPEGRRLLRDQHGNLLRVADYCHGNYLQAGDKRKALEETMALSTQSLASVTYQVSSLASAFLRLLDLQAAQLHQVEAEVACVAQSVAVHKEKVSRREIGALAVPKVFPSHLKVVAPPSPPVLEPYYRKPLNFSVLDDIGHGVKDTSTQLSRTGTLARKGTKSSKSCSAHGAGTLGRSSRVPEPVQPPVVPEGKLSAASSSSSSSSSSSLVSLSSGGAPAAPGEGIPAPPPLPGPPLLAPSPPGPPLPGPPLLAPSPPGPPLPPAAAIPPPPPLPGDLLPPPPGDLAVPPGALLPAARDDLEPPLPPSAVPDLGDLALPPPPAAEDLPWAPERYLDEAVAPHPHTRQKDSELAPEPGAPLLVPRRHSGGWSGGVAERGLPPGDSGQPL